MGGTIELTNDVALIKAGDRVGMSEATLLNMLGISPFTYGLGVTKVYDSGSIFDPSILDITDDYLKAHVLVGIRNIAALCLKIGYPTVARPSFHYQWFEELHGRGCCHGHHLQGG